jgi:hypothetical protein
MSERKGRPTLSRRPGSLGASPETRGSAKGERCGSYFIGDATPAEAWLSSGRTGTVLLDGFTLRMQDAGQTMGIITSNCNEATTTDNLLDGITAADEL